VRQGLYDLAYYSVNEGFWKNVQVKKQTEPVEILVVSHANFISVVVDRSQFTIPNFGSLKQTNEGSTGRRFHNAEHKSYVSASDEQISQDASKYKLYIFRKGT
jgi:hypothetical protein